MLRWYEWVLFIVLLITMVFGGVLIFNALTGNPDLFVPFQAPHLAGMTTKLEPVNGSVTNIVTGGSDNYNCGGVGQFCDPTLGLACRQGQCLCVDTGSQFCPSLGCVNFSTSSVACGGCNSTGCGPMSKCCSGTCKLMNTITDCSSCGNTCTGTSPGCCGGKCVDNDTDPENCGACFQPIPSIGYRCCAGKSTAIDNNNCTSCGNVCPVGTICDVNSKTCISGCQTGFVKCSGSSGACSDLSSDNFHCGACDTPCPSGTFCLGGQCIPNTCPSGSIFFNGQCLPQSGNSSCGQVGVSCPTFCINNACTCVSGVNCPPGYSCSNGQCIAPSCPDGQIFCGGSRTCVTLATGDAQGRNCGMCGNNCLSGQCDNGQCVCTNTSQCFAGFDCVGNRCVLH